MGNSDARIAARPDIDDDLTGLAGNRLKPCICQLFNNGVPAQTGHVGAMADASFSFASQPALAPGLVPVGQTRWDPTGDAHAATTDPHAAGGYEPNHILLDVDLLPAAVQSDIDVSRHEHDHSLLTISCRQPSACPSTAIILNDESSSPHPLPKLSWDFSCRESCTESLDASALDIQDCVRLAQGRAAAESFHAAVSHSTPVCYLSWL